MHDVIVIGGGVIGLAIARELRPHLSLLVVERGAVGSEASWAAAGMLSPQSEADDMGPFFRLSMSSLRMCRDFASNLQRETGIDTDYSDEGLILLASTEDDLEVLRRRYQSQKQAGLEVKFLAPDQILKREPLITLSLKGALFFPGDRQVAPRRLLQALEQSCSQRSVEVRTGVQVESILHGSDGVRGVLTSGGVFEAPRVIVAAGTWSGQIGGLDPPIPVRPRKGQILSLRMPGPVIRHMVRWQHSYFIPRKDGELIVGATDEEAGYDRSLTPAGIGGLLGDAQRISSHVASYPIVETWTGLRPATPDALPILGGAGVRGLFYATGHYRNGILLAPITATILRDLIQSGKTSEPIEAFSPFRFKQNRV